MKVENTIEYIEASKKANSMRWHRADDYINSRGLVVNYLQNNDFNREFKNGFSK